MRRTLIAILLVTPTLLFARGSLKELTLPLKFVPQEGVHASSAALPPGVLDQTVELRVEDARRLPDLLTIGQCTGGDDKTFPFAPTANRARTFRKRSPRSTRAGP
jgi:hypothetical protein